jgi:hypothetical protein
LVRDGEVDDMVERIRDRSGDDPIDRRREAE